MSLLQDIQKQTGFKPNAWFKLTHKETGKVCTMKAQIDGDRELDLINNYRKLFTITGISEEEFNKLTEEIQLH